jgi:hypothetical protein
MIRIEAKPKFDSIALIDLHVNRVDQLGDRVVIKVALVNSKSHQVMSHSSMEGIIMSDNSKELLSRLVQSLEEDSAKILFEIESKEEVNYGHEPKGIADEPEEAIQI